MFIGLLSTSADERPHVRQTLFTWIPVGALHVDVGVPRRPAVDHDGPVRHRRRRADPPVLDRLHARRPEVLQVLRLPEPVRLLDARCSCSATTSLVTFLGWEGVGTCSYLLISFWFDARRRRRRRQEGVRHQPRRRLRLHDRDVPRSSSASGSLNYIGDHRRGADAGRSRRRRRSRCCCSSAPCGKRAQLPLYIWLPDAMEGPTPVSALIHAATMVTAGVYLMCRHQPGARRSVADWRRRSSPSSASITALFAATIAVAQNDIKKVLAYSTVSQLGYMFLAVGSGAYVAADLPHDHPRLLQGAAVPRRRLGDPRHARRAGHAAHGRAAQVHADHRGHVHRRLAGDRRRAAVRRLLVEGRDPARTPATRARRCGSSASSPRCSPRST